MKKVTVSSNKFKFIANEELNPVKKKIKRKKAKNKGRVWGFDIGKALEEVERNVRDSFKKIGFERSGIVRKSLAPKTIN